MVGVSRDPNDFSVKLFTELCGRGYDMVPVNPRAQQLLGRRCFARVEEIEPPVSAVLLMTTPDVTDAVIGDCADAGVGYVWMYRAGGPHSANQGAVSPNAIDFCRAAGIEVVPGECPYMFLPGAGIHRLHGLIRQIVGTYPRRELEQELRVA